MRKVLALSICFTLAGVVSQAQAQFSTDWESGPMGWTASGPAPQWALGAGLGGAPGAFSGQNYWFAQDLVGPSSDFLTSPDFAVGGGSLTLSFWHRWDMENTFDGGVLEVSVNSGAFQYVPNSAFTQNGYTATISSSFGSPIGGLEAFTNVQATYLESIVDLSGFAGAGDTIAIQFHQADDSSVTDDGWYIDDVTLVPEPGALALLGLGALALIRRR